MTERIRRPPRRRSGPGGLTAERIEHLVFGYVLFAEFALDDREATALWIEHTDDLLPDFILRHPGCRPWAWWLLQVPITGPRRQLRDGPRALNPPVWFGIPSRWENVPPGGTFESERDYLQRHGLLTEDEQRLLTAADGPVSGRWSV